MAHVHFTSNLRRHVESSSMEGPGETVRELLEIVFAKNSRLQTYVLDDQGGVRKHMRILVDGLAIKDLEKLSDPIKKDSEVWIMQALSGG